MNHDKRLIFVRHSLTEHVASVPARDWNLSEDGRIRARKLVNKLIEYHPEVIVSSDGQRHSKLLKLSVKALG